MPSSLFVHWPNVTGQARPTWGETNVCSERKPSHCANVTGQGTRHLVAGTLHPLVGPHVSPSNMSKSTGNWSAISRAFS